MIGALGIPLVEKPGFEADDVIATLACEAAAAGIETFLVTRDKDFMQLLGSSIRMYDLKRGTADPEILGAEGAVARQAVAEKRVRSAFPRASGS